MPLFRVKIQPSSYTNTKFQHHVIWDNDRRDTYYCRYITRPDNIIWLSHFDNFFFNCIFIVLPLNLDVWYSSIFNGITKPYFSQRLSTCLSIYRFIVYIEVHMHMYNNECRNIYLCIAGVLQVIDSAWKLVFRIKYYFITMKFIMLCK